MPVVIAERVRAGGVVLVDGWPLCLAVHRRGQGRE